MLVKEIMTHNVEVLSPGDTLEHAALRMEELNVGPLPVCEGNRLVGISPTATSPRGRLPPAATRRRPLFARRCPTTSPGATRTRTSARRRS